MIGSSQWRHSTRDKLVSISRIGDAKKTKNFYTVTFVGEAKGEHDRNMEIYEARYDYCDDCGDSLLSFSKGDKFLITEKGEGGWWAAQSLSSNEIGYIPSSFVEVRY